MAPMSESRNHHTLALILAVLVATAAAFAALPQGRAMVKQWLFSAGLIYADPITGWIDRCMFLATG